MGNTLSRRALLTRLVGGAGGAAATAVMLPSNALAQHAHGQAHAHHGAGEPGSAAAREIAGEHADHPMIPRIEKGRRYSPPPATMGQQMGRVVTPGQPPIGYEMDGEVKVFRLILQPTWVTITEGKEYPDKGKWTYMPSWPKKALAWGMNGICPGPTLEATEGDRVRIIVRNELPEPTSIHWHGFELPFREDGAASWFPHSAQQPILPNEEHVYEFSLIQSGTLMYHSGFNVMKQEGMGVAGMFVVHPKDDPDPPDREFAILLQTWHFQPDNPNPDLVMMEPTYATFNGKTSPYLDWMRVKQGEKVRIRIGNLSLMAHPIHLHGYTFQIVGTGGGPIPETARWDDVTVNVPPGSSRDIEFVAWNPGNWRFHCHILHHVMNQMADTPMGIHAPEGMFTIFSVEPSDPGYDIHSPRAPWVGPNGERP